MTPSLKEIASRIEHTLLRPEVRVEQIDRLCEESVEFEFAGVCVHPIHVARAASCLDKCVAESNRRFPFVVSVAGFPLGANRTETKATEAERALDDGAAEIDMVVNLGALIGGDLRAVRTDVEAVADAVHRHAPAAILKVILETSALTETQIIQGCRASAEGEADFVKTSTGFHPSGGATVVAVRLLHRHASPMRVKASGGIRTAAATRALIDAGADRIGTSSGVSILRELTSESH